MGLPGKSVVARKLLVDVRNMPSQVFRKICVLQPSYGLSNLAPSKACAAMPGQRRDLRTVRQLRDLVAALEPDS